MLKNIKPIFGICYILIIYKKIIIGRNKALEEHRSKGDNPEFIPNLKIVRMKNKSFWYYFAIKKTNKGKYQAGQHH